MARSLWTGSISFGLVNVPVKAFTAVRDHDVHAKCTSPGVDAGDRGLRFRRTRTDRSDLLREHLLAGPRR